MAQFRVSELLRLFARWADRSGLPDDQDARVDIINERGRDLRDYCENYAFEIAREFSRLITAAEWTRELPTEIGHYWFVPESEVGHPEAVRDVIHVDSDGVRSIGAGDLVTWKLVGRFCRLPEPPPIYEETPPGAIHVAMTDEERLEYHQEANRVRELRGQKPRAWARRGFGDHPADCICKTLKNQPTEEQS